MTVLSRILQYKMGKKEVEQLLLSILISCFFFIFLPTTKNNFVNAQNPVDSGPTQVSAFIPENLPPSTPILISPTNNSIITTNLPTFVWQASTDDRGISHYQLYLDGNLHFDNVPTYPTNNSLYTLTYNPDNSQYSLTLRQGLGDGSHSWKIRAVDVLASFADSVTWNFVIDTKAPYFNITNLEKKNSSPESWNNELNPHISSQDSSTIPSQPIEIDFNEPLLAGIGEKNSSVVLIISSPGETNKSYQFEIDSNGKWQLQLGILPRGKILTLNFTITDQAGFVTVLENIMLYIKIPTVVIPPSDQTPTTMPGDTTPSEETPASTGSAILELPYLPPKEIIHQIKEELKAIAPQPIAQLASALPQQTRRMITSGYQSLTPILALILALITPVGSILLVASKFNQPLSFPLLKKIGYAVGVFPRGKKQGIVIDDDQNNGVAFGLVSVAGVDDFHYIKDSVITDRFGFFGGIKLPEGKYRLTFREDRYLFPTNNHWNYTGFAHCLSQENYYQGQEFRIRENNRLPMMIVPTTRINFNNSFEVMDKIRNKVASLNEYPPVFLATMTGLIFYVCVSYPVISNWAVFSVYGLLWLKKIKAKLFDKYIEIQTIDADSKVVENVVVKVEKWANKNQNQLANGINGDIAISDQKGEAKIVKSPSNHDEIVKVTASRVDLDWIEAKNHDQTCFFEAKTLKKIIVVMRKKKLETATK